MKNIVKSPFFNTCLIILILFGSIACKEEIESDPDIEGIPDTTKVSDFEGNIYSTIKIGTQLWLAENLKTTYNSSGDSLNGVFVYDDNENNVNTFGMLYTWESAINACPEGWHLPSDIEWNELISTLGSHAGDKLKVGGTSGFNAKMAGLRISDGSFVGLGSLGVFWSSSESGDHATTKLIVVNEPDVVVDDNAPKNSSLSVRYIKD